MKQGIPPAAVIGIIAVVVLAAVFIGFKMFGTHQVDTPTASGYPKDFKPGTGYTVDSSGQQPAKPTSNGHNAPSGYNGR